MNRNSARKIGWPRIYFLGLLMVFLALSMADLRAQRSPFDSVWISEAAQIREEVECFTDRSLYMVEELIQFRAQLSDIGPTGPAPWSKVLYVELLTVDGKRVNGGKFPIHKQVTSGKLRIPDNLLTGRYYLRVYTRWMRNWEPESFTYLPIRIINPHRSELYPVSSPETKTKLPLLRGDSELNLELFESGSAFARGDSVEYDVLFSGVQEQDSLGGCFTVVPLGMEPSLMPYPEVLAEEKFQLDFLPDKFGPSISGSVHYPDGFLEELSPTVIHFTLMGTNAGYFVCRSDAQGKFSVGLPMHSGKLEIFVQPESPQKEAREVRIDQDFDPRPVRLPDSPFTLTEKEIEWATIMARNVQLAEIYGQADTPGNPDSLKLTSMFYGEPSFSVDLDQYVLLPTLREVFLNLVPSVTPTTRNGISTLLIESVNPSLSLYESLVMVDQVPVLDMEQFMAMSPAKIKQIDVIEDVYVKGDLRFGGIINLHSRDQDMAGIDLPQNSFFIDYMALEPSITSQEVTATPGDVIPDLRNTFLWVPAYTLLKGSSQKISFIAPDYPGEYVIIFRGLTQEGELVLAKSTFEVR